MARSAARRSGFSRKKATASRRAAIERAIGQGRRKPLGQKSRAAGRDGEIDDREQRALARAGQRARQFEIGARRGVDFKRRRARRLRRTGQRRALSLLRALDIEDRRRGGGEFAVAEGAEAVERRDGVETP